MNNKLLYAATLAVSLLGTLVIAAEVPAPSRTAAEFAAAVAMAAPSIGTI